MHRDGKGENPREHRELCDRGECSQQRGNLKDDGYIPYGFQDASRRQGSESPGA
ncbi:hypothetical protein [Photorhabdus bodei]|uniref:hypothetical protein n=1 Tax=Photorhabdus bodei TaxID=2029681 RepID=UPI001EE4A025|nr:hypothetical protein [Photorhabdus bodei]